MQQPLRRPPTVHKRTFFFITLCWLVMISCSLAWNWYESEQAAFRYARLVATASFDKDLVYRRWAALQGGLYVTPSEQTPPNPYLAHIQDRDLLTTTGRHLTLINPAYMTRQVHELGKKHYGSQGHITSPTPLNPTNVPDLWEKKALKQFQQGHTEVVSLEIMGKSPVLRLMRPLETESSCLKCHAEQGDLRGGISVTVPFTTYAKDAHHQQLQLLVAHLVIAGMGLLGLIRGYWALNSSEYKLYQSEQRHRAILQAALEGFWSMSTNGRLLEANQTYSRMSGFSLEELQDKNIDDLDAVYSKDALQHMIHKAVETGSCRFESRHRRSDGRLFDVEIHIQYPFPELGQLVVFLHDITARKQMRDISNFLARSSFITDGRSFFDRLADYIGRLLDVEVVRIDRLSPDGRQTWSLSLWRRGEFVDNVTSPLEGTPGALLLNREVCCYPSGVRDQFPTDPFLQTMALESYVGVPLLDHDGHPIGLLSILGRDPLPHPEQVEAVLKLVAVRVAGEMRRLLMMETLEESEAEHRLIINNMQECLAVLDDQGIFRFVNDRMAAHLSTAPPRLIGQSLRYYLPPDQGEQLLSQCSHCLRTGKGDASEVFLQLHKDERWWYLSLLPIRFGKKQIPAVLTLLLDITRRKEAQEALLQKDALLRAMLRNLPFDFLARDKDQQIIMQSDQSIAAWGDLSLGDWKEPPLAPETLERWQLSNSRVLSGEVVNEECSLVFRDGRQREVHNIVAPIREADEIVGILDINIDITDRKHEEEEKRSLQTQLMQSQKLQAIGTLAGGIAHDFNNILGAILGYGEMIREISPEHTDVAAYAGNVLEAGNRAALLVKQILAFSRQAESERIPLTPAHLVKEVITLIRPALPTTIALEINIDKNTSPILADPTQIHQVVMNLCTNAYHAMELTGGTMEIILQDSELKFSDLQQYPQIQPGTFIHLSIRDTGPGIAPEIRDKIFDPYFSTKTLGKGTGLGLSIVHGVVSSHGGLVNCVSHLGQGTVFHIYIPALLSFPEDESKITETMPIGSEHILLLDDEELLVDLGRVLLQRLGYSSTTFTDPHEALAAFRATPDLFDAVLTDLTMPGMTGIDVAHELLHIRPDIPIILCTGYNGLLDGIELESLGIKAFAMKPLTKRELAVLLEQVLADQRKSSMNPNDASTRYTLRK